MTLDLNNLTNLPSNVEGTISDASNDSANFFERFILGNLPDTISRTTHGLVLRINGRIIGAVDNFTFSSSQDLAEEFELGRYDGLPNHLTPGNLSGRTISLNRVDLYTDIFEDMTQGRGGAFGTGSRVDLVHLGLARIPFTLDEAWDAPDVQPSRVYRHTCRWQSINRTGQATGDRISRCTGTAIWYARKALTGADAFVPRPRF